MRRIILALSLLLACLYGRADAREMSFPGGAGGTWLYTLSSCGSPPCYIPSVTGVSPGWAAYWTPQIYNSGGSYTATIQAMNAGFDPSVAGSWVDITTTSASSFAVPFGPFHAIRIKVTACSGCGISTSLLAVEP